MTVTKSDITKAIDSLNLKNRAICLHSSLSSFGHVAGGAKSVIEAFLDSGCTLLVPGFTYDYTISPPLDMRPLRNGMNYEKEVGNFVPNEKIYTVDSNAISKSLGTIPYEILHMPQRKRGYHPINSFVAIGPKASELVAKQTAQDVYAPLRALCEMDGVVLLMGVDLTKMTAIHYAEELAGRNLFVRWANGPDGKPMCASVGSCSNGFNQLAPFVEGIETRIEVGNSLWRVFPAKDVIARCADAIRENQEITRCNNPDCDRCNDATQGGPIL